MFIALESSLIYTNWLMILELIIAIEWSLSALLM